MGQPRIDRSESGTFTPLTAGGVRGSTITLACTAIGGGVLTLSYGLSLTGAALGMAMLALTGTVAGFGIDIMLRGAVKLEAVNTASLLARTFGAWTGPALDVCLATYGTGALTAYFILLGDILPTVLKMGEAMHLFSPVDLPDATLRTRCILATLVVVVPLAIPRTLAALRYASPVSIVAVISFSAYIIAYCPTYYELNVGEPSFGEVKYFVLDRSLFKAFGIFLFAYNCHLNVVPTASELRRTDSKAISKISSGTALVLMSGYIVVALGGYLSFVGATQQNLFKNYGMSSVMMVVRSVFALAIMIGVPANLAPTARSMVCLVRGSSARQPSLNSPNGNEALLGTDGARGRANTLLTDQDGLLLLIMKAVVVAISLMIAINVPNVADVMGFMGSTVGTVLMMIIPLAVLHSVELDAYGKTKKACVTCLLGSATCVSCLSISEMVLSYFGLLPA